MSAHLRTVPFYGTLLGIVLLNPAIAFGTCPDLSGSGGPDYDAEDCWVGIVEVCSHSGTTWECNVADDTAAAVVNVVTDFDGYDSTLEAWGDYAGAHFCCVLDLDTYSTSTVLVEGSAYGDTLAFSYSSRSYNLYTPAGYSSITGKIYGNGGNDSIFGSDFSGSSYSELLYAMAGGAGVDTMDGGTGGDHVCGDVGNDILDDGDATGEVSPDRLFGPGTGDTLYCNHTSTYWDTNGLGTCTGSNPTQALRPSQCP